MHKTKIVILDGYVENPGDLSWSAIEALGNVTLYDRCPNDDDEIIRRIGDAEILVANKTPISRRVIESTNLKLITILATGYTDSNFVAFFNHLIIINCFSDKTVKLL